MNSGKLKELPVSIKRPFLGCDSKPFEKGRISGAKMEGVDHGLGGFWIREFRKKAGFAKVKVGLNKGHYDAIEGT